MKFFVRTIVLSLLGFSLAVPVLASQHKTEKSDSAKEDSKKMKKMPDSFKPFCMQNAPKMTAEVKKEEKTVVMRLAAKKESDVDAVQSTAARMVEMHNSHRQMDMPMGMKKGHMWKGKHKGHKMMKGKRMASMWKAKPKMSKTENGAKINFHPAQKDHLDALHKHLKFRADRIKDGQLCGMMGMGKKRMK
jgi:hypothetical protein